MHARPTGLEAVSAMGEFAGAEATAQGNITVYLPELHVLTPEALRKLARTRSLEQWIDYNPEGVPHADHA